MIKALKRELRLIYNTQEQSQDGKRITCLDMTRGILIILVVIGHSGLITATCNTWLSTFHLPGFFLLSGVLMQLKREEKSPLPAVILQKARGIMIPYLWFSLGSVCLDLLQVLLGKFTWNIVVEHALQTITLQGYSVLWFLPVLFFAEIMLLAMYRIYRKILRPGSCQSACRKMLVAGIVSLLMTIVSVGCYYGYHRLVLLAIPQLALFSIRILVKAVMGGAFMSYGYLFGCLFGNTSKKNQALPQKLCIFAVGVLLFSVNLLLLPRIQLMDFNQLNLQSPWIYLALGTTGSLGCLLTCMSIPNIPLITFFGQNSLIIMCTHMNFYIMLLGMRISELIIALISGSGSITYAILSLAGTLLLSIPVIIVIRVFFPFVLGKKFTYKA